LDTLTPILLICLTWLPLVVAFVGLGLLAHHLHGGDELNGETLVSAMWLGFAILIIYLQLWNLWFPTGGGLAMAIVLSVGLLAIVLQFRRLKQWLAESVARHYIAWSLLVIMLAWIAHRAAGPCTCPDSGLYHINAVKWSAQYPIILGIANLHDRLALNNSNFLVGGMFEFGMWTHRSHNLANGMLVAMLMITAVSAIARGWRCRRRLRPDHVFGAMLLCATLLLGLHRGAFNISSHSSNLAVAVTVMAALYLMLSEILRSRSTWGTPQSNFAMLSATALLTASVTIKLSVVVTCGLAWLILVSIWWRRMRITSAAITSPLIAFVVISTLLIGPWMVRSFLMSGYPVFPKTIGGMNVDWALPAAKADQLSQLITSWSQNKAHPGEIQGWSWLKPWWTRLLRQDDRYEAVVVPLWMTAGGLVIMLLRIHRVWRYRADALRTLWLLPPIFAGMIFWFLVAPDPRFAVYLFYSLAAVVIAVALGTTARSRRNISKRISLIICMLLALTPVAYRLTPKYHRPGDSFGDRLTNVLFIKPGPDRGFYKLPPPRLERRVTNFGLEVYVIRPGGATWNGPLVTTQRSRYSPRLRLRDPDAGVRGGFNLAPE